MIQEITLIYCMKCHDDTKHNVVNHPGVILWTCENCGKTNDHDYDLLNSEGNL